MNASELARSFADILGDWLTPEQFAEMREKNRANICANICASHDYCDANEAMLDAFEYLAHREADLIDDADLINEAWNIAKREYLTATN